MKSILIKDMDLQIYYAQHTQSTLLYIHVEVQLPKELESKLRDEAAGERV